MTIYFCTKMLLSRILVVSFFVIIFISITSSSMTIIPIISSTIISSTSIPPLFDSPVFSLSTCDNNIENIEEIHDNTRVASTMNIVTYASPVGFHPYRIWAIGLYKGTLSHELFCKTKYGTLQLLNKEHINLIPLLGGTSGRDCNKQEECIKLGYEWIHDPISSSSSSNENDDDNDDDNDNSNMLQKHHPMILPGCLYYIKLQCLEIYDAGNHDVAICKVISMAKTTTTSKDDNNNTKNSSNDSYNNDETTSYLSTRILRDMGIINNQGGIATKS